MNPTILLAGVVLALVGCEAMDERNVKGEITLGESPKGSCESNASQSGSIDATQAVTQAAELASLRTLAATAESPQVRRQAFARIQEIESPPKTSGGQSLCVRVSDGECVVSTDPTACRVEGEG